MMKSKYDFPLINGFISDKLNLIIILIKINFNKTALIMRYKNYN